MLGVWLPAIQTDSMSWVWRISFSRLVLSTTESIHLPVSSSRVCHRPACASRLSPVDVTIVRSGIKLAPTIDSNSPCSNYP